MHLIYHPSFVEHEQWPGHPERPERLLAIKQAMEEAGLWKEPVDIEPADMDLIRHIHEPGYLERLEHQRATFLDADTFWGDCTYDIAMRALGGAHTGTLKTFATGTPSLCLLRPPGHHAGPGYFGGFCYFNNAALAAETARWKGVDRVAIVDIDVHHGNGTRDIMAQRKDVLYISTHQWGIFPGTGPAEDVGTGEGEGYTVNIPLSSGSGDSTFTSAFERMIEPILRQYKPGFLVVSIGMDAHYMDPLATLALSTPGYLECCRRLVELGKELCHGKTVFVLEGGYNLEALADVGVGLAAMLEDRDGPPPKLCMNRDTDINGEDSIQAAVGVQQRYWKL